VIRSGPNVEVVDSGSLPPEPATTFASRAMGSALRLTIGAALEAGSPTAARAWESVLRIFDAAETAMSRFSETSELTALNRLAPSRTSVALSPMLRRALVAADRAHRITAGRFDPRVLSDLDRLGYTGAPIEPVAVRTDLAARVVTMSELGARLARPVDLGGIGKGLALRWAADAVERLGVTHFLLEAGGDLVARGRDTDHEPWSIGIEDPANVAEHLAVIAVTDMAVATSSVAVNRWTVAGRTVHHLIDPRTGEPAASGLTAVTVVGPDPAWAEIWSKVLFIGGRSSIASEACAHGLAAWWAADDGSFEMTPAGRAMTAWLESDAVWAEEGEPRQVCGVPRRVGHHQRGRRPPCRSSVDIARISSST
jgi:thiamine biosynthesis lipoprotein